MFKCIKEVAMEKEIRFQADKIYRVHQENYNTGHKVIDETGTPHVVGQEGKKWFDEHFRELNDEEYYNLMVEYYSEMENHDELETKALQESIKKQIENAVAPYKAFYDFFKEMHGKGVGLENYYSNGDEEYFDIIFEVAEEKAKIK